MTSQNTSCWLFTFLIFIFICFWAGERGRERRDTWRSTKIVWINNGSEFVDLSTIRIDPIDLDQIRDDLDNDIDTEGQQVTPEPPQSEEISSESESEQIVEEMRQLVTPNVTQSYMLTSTYLSPFLDEANGDLEDATLAFMEHLEWRQEYGIDYILDLDLTSFGDLPSEFPNYSDGFDKEGRPIISGDISSWDMRRMTMQSGKGAKLLRFIFRQYELSSKLIRDAALKGTQIDGIVILYNLDGFNLVQHGCLQCLRYYIKSMHGLQDNYPGLLRKLILINVPEEFDLFLRLAPNRISKVMVTFGSKKAEWQDYILNLIDADQIRPQFGGTRVDYDSEEA